MRSPAGLLPYLDTVACYKPCLLSLAVCVCRCPNICGDRTNDCHCSQGNLLGWFSPLPLLTADWLLGATNNVVAAVCPPDASVAWASRVDELSLLFPNDKVVFSKSAFHDKRLPIGA